MTPNLPFSISFLYPTYLWLLFLGLLFLVVGWPKKNAPDFRQKLLARIIRLIIFLALVFSLAEVQLKRPVDTVTTVFVLDVSDSMNGEAATQAEAFLQQAIAQKPPEEQIGIILFGQDALVEQLPAKDNTVATLDSIPIKKATNIESALQLALALLPNEGGGRIVLLSDGQQTIGNATQIATLAAARKVAINIYPAITTSDNAKNTEVLVKQLSAPSQARQGQAVSVEAIIKSNNPTQATLHLFADNALVESRVVQLNKGDNQFGFSIPLETTGFHRFRVDVETNTDRQIQNNWGAAFTTVHGPPKILVVEGISGEADSLITALAAANLNTTLIDPTALPTTLADLATYDSIMLVNIPAPALSTATQEALNNFVRDLGRGLIMIGGPDSYGAGRYHRTPIEKALPVDMDIRNRNKEANIALVLAVDKSGSMGACHCDDPNSRLAKQSRIPSGIPKIDIAKEAIFQSSQVLGDLDYLGVVAFDVTAKWALETAPRANTLAIEQAIGGLNANGQTNIFVGLAAAEESLLNTSARIKHMILLTDGWSTAGAYDNLTNRLTEEGITLSVVAAGAGSAEYLANLAEKGGGKYYPAASMIDIPQIFLKETIRAVENYIIEEPFLVVPAVIAPSGQVANSILQNIALDTAPPLLGYNGTTPKNTAQIGLLTPRGDPLLASWQYGLGHSVAWTSDFSGRWAKEWVNWTHFPQFVGQLVNWTLPNPSNNQFNLKTTSNNGEVTLEATVYDTNGQLYNFLDVTAQILNQDGKSTTITLPATGPGQYQATIDSLVEGVHLMQVTGYAKRTSETTSTIPIASQTTGLVIPYSPEYGYLDTNLDLLQDLRRVTNGVILQTADESFINRLPPGYQTKPLWSALLLLVAFLFPIDVAIRRLRLGHREWRQFQQWLVEHVPSLTPKSTPTQTEPPLLSELFAARQRVREQQESVVTTPPQASESSQTNSVEHSSSTEAPPTQSPLGEDEAIENKGEDTLTRLKAAKKRAKKS